MWTVTIAVYTCVEVIEMRRWTKPSHRSPPSATPASAAGSGGSMVGEKWPRVMGLSAVVKDARLHEALKSMYIPRSLLRIGSTIGRGLFNH